MPTSRRLGEYTIHGEYDPRTRQTVVEAVYVAGRRLPDPDARRLVQAQAHQIDEVFGHARRNGGRSWIAHAPGLPEDTYIHYGGPHFRGERARLHERILARALAKCGSRGRPEAIIMMGGPASGKSHTLNALGLKGFVHIDSDAFKAMLPEYQQALDAHARDAAAMVHEESSHLAAEALARAVNQRCSLIYDGTGKNAQRYVRMVTDLKHAGYSVRLIFVNVDPSVAVPRAIARAEATGRFVPLNVITGAYAQIPHNFATVANRADAWDFFDTTAPPAVFVASKADGAAPVVHDPAVFADFFERFPQREALNMRARGTRRNPTRRVPHAAMLANLDHFLASL